MQPIISLNAPGGSYHVEVLLRFKNEKDELLPTNVLINLAAQNGSITAIDKWVFRTTLEWLGQNHEELHHIDWVNLNRSEEHTSELQSRGHLVCRLLLEKKKSGIARPHTIVMRQL